MGEFQHRAPAYGGTTEPVTSIDSPARRTFFRVAMVIVALEPLVIMGVLLAVGLPWQLIVLMLAALVGFLALVFWLLVRVLWKPMERLYPAQPILPGAVSKSWQSFAFGPLSRLNNCLTIVADERHLHLQPLAPMQWLGAGWLSLPLDRMTDIRPGLLGQMTAGLDGRTIAGPAWCLSLAEGTSEHMAADN
jgi:hypothetical protein